MTDQKVNPEVATDPGWSGSGGDDVFERLAASLAEQYQFITYRKQGPLVSKDLPDYRTIFLETVQRFRGAADKEPALSYAAEWVLDNDFLVITALRQIEEDFPADYERQLPVLAGEAGAGWLRVYALARELVLMGRAQLNLDGVRGFLTAFQAITPLTMGELWALPILLRLSIVQALILAAARSTGIESRLEKLSLPPIDWDPEAGAGEIIANAFVSLRALAAEDWKAYFEEVSLVERVLAQDPAQVYARMDFDTRDRYRKTVETLARRTGQGELQVAQAAVELAQVRVDRRPGPTPGDSQELIPPDRREHLGFYLLDGGRPELEERIGYRPTGNIRLGRWAAARAVPLFLLLLAGVTGLILAVFTFHASAAGGATWQVLLAAALGFVPALTAAVHLVNWLVTRVVPPRVLPKMDFSEGLPPDCSTLVVVPAILSHAREVTSLLSQLELHYLRNRDERLFFALLSDLPDADQPRLPADELLVQQAVTGIEELNRKYPRPDGDPFLLLHRHRRWNECEGKWMGWERKRGKLHELNELILASRSLSGSGVAAGEGLADLRGDGRRETSEPTSPVPIVFAVQAGPVEVLAEIRFVITLDADTVLLSGNASRLAATLAHPLNRPEFNAAGKIRAGYSILQPRTEISPTSAFRSIFTRVFSGDAGLDLYTLAVSDVYQDLFGEGTYVGKGIYEVEAFERSLAGRAPENALLSHDLFEGVHGRAGLVTDVVLLEDYPSRYLAEALRLYRWIRGDWQLIPWLLPRVPGERGRLPNRLSPLGRWKILDNLRRSLVLPGVWVLLAAGWLGVLPGLPLFWTLAGLLALAMPLLTDLIVALVQAGRTVGTEGAARRAAQPLRLSFLRLVLAAAFLPYEAYLAVDAIAVTLRRVLITRRDLLQWTTAAQTERSIKKGEGRANTWWVMRIAPVSAVGLAALLAVVRPAALPAAAILLLLWLIAPEIAHRISQPVRLEVEPLAEEDRSRLHRLARRTWLFFEQFVGPDDHWLPPDHYQEFPLGAVASRTSPTNIGLNLLTILGAYDLGYIGLLGLSTRLRSSFDTLARLERIRGHFLNWYDTRSLNPLEPRYLSTVDSGNLAACLIALRQGLLSLPAAPVLRWETFAGLLDSLAVLEDHLESLEPGEALPPSAEPLAVMAAMRERIEQTRGQPHEWAALLIELSDPGPESSEVSWTGLDLSLLAFVEARAGALDAESIRRLRLYALSTRQRLDNARRELDLLHPWVTALAHPPALFARAEGFPGLEAAWAALGGVFSPGLRVDQIGAAAAAGLTALAALLAELDLLVHAQPSRVSAEAAVAAADWALSFHGQLESVSLAAKALQIGLQALADEAEAFFQEMDFRFLFDPDRQVFHIGFNQTLGKLDDNYYDLLASEARITSLLAIAKGQAPVEHWLHLARPMARVDGRLALLSWSATMFEYLMPLLLVRNYRDTLLEASAFAAVDLQIDYGQANGTPWGISESGYYRFDPALAYQYRAFGVPGLGYKRGLGDDLVIAPYASLLALPLRPRAVLQNLAALDELGALGAFGLYEAVDFTPERLPLGRKFELVQEYMAHHQGMIFLSLVNTLRENIMVERFHRDPRIRSVELLLQEQIPTGAPLEQPHTQEGHAIRPETPQVIMTPWRVRRNAPQPRVHFLSNGRFSTLITASGGGYSAWNDVALTRWRADTTLGGWGTWIYIQDLERDQLWSASYEPTAQMAEGRDVYFHAHMAVFSRQDGDLASELEIVVAPEEDVEIRSLTLANRGDPPRRLRLTSYAEVVLGPPASDGRHPAYSKLFVESEYLPAENALVFHRRPRAEDEAGAYLVHALLIDGEIPRTGAFEADRARFLGRGGTRRAPRALQAGTWLSGTAGATLDPVMALGQELELEPHTSVRLAWITAAAASRSEALDLAGRYTAWNAIERATQMARAAAEVELRQLGLHTTQLPRIQHLLSALLYPHQALRAPADTLRANRKGQPGLWPYAISGDYPVLLARIGSLDELVLVQDLLQAHAYWRSRRLLIDLVILNEQGVAYGQELNAQLHRLLTRTGSDAWLNRRGGIFLLLADGLTPEDRILLETAARVILDGSGGGLEEQITVRERLPARLPEFHPGPPDAAEPEPTAPVVRPQDLRFDNGLGGFSPDGREYVIFLEPGQTTPAPWINVIANPEFGCLASEAGLGTTWAANSGENRLTPWSNDPVSDPPGEALYLRDEETAILWSPTPGPAPAPAPYLIRHGAGYTEYEHASYGLKQHLRLFVVPDAPLKVIRLRLENTWNRGRRITVTYYAEWVLGINREESQQYILPEYDGETQTLFARNPYNVEFGERAAFATASKKLHGLTDDRTEFLGRLGDPAQPGALKRIGLAGTVQPGLDPCAALQLHVELQPGEVEEVYFLLGQGSDRAEALQLVQKYQQPEAVRAAWEAVGETWEALLGAVTVRTPEPALDLLLNRWLLYQALACRIWGRSAFYQSSGAYGFRDQLQDVMSLVYAAPHLAREHLLRAASHQFESGDVLHWWHPPSGRGVRTRFSDDLLWLPYVTAFYVSTTGDQTVLDEKVPFRTGPFLEPGQEERYGQYATTPEAYPLYEHCLRAIEKGMTKGAHGLPLIGSGDWNDGMNRVGHEGRGESVWLAWFLIGTLQDFARVCERRGENDLASRLRRRAEEYAQAVEASAWDGGWYLRAFYDDGSPLGSSKNLECQIDAIAQSWAVLTGAGEAERIHQAMQAVSDRLVRPEDGLILLFTPPFNRTRHDPGYIKGYVPGVRENGGQYTHAAIWTVWAQAELGQGDEAEALFRLLNPIYHADTREKAERYKVEPYVVAADVYGAPPHTGRGGWTWYTGSAGWLYRLGLEALLGLRRDGAVFTLDPCIPAAWPGYEITLRQGEVVFEILIENPDRVQRGVAEITLDGKVMNPGKVPLLDDGKTHQVRVLLGPAKGSSF